MSDCFEEKQETVVFGSAFDPPHWGHSLVIHALAQNPKIEAIWVQVSPPRWDKTPYASQGLRESWGAALLSRMQAGCDLKRKVRLELRFDEAKLQGEARISRGTGVLLDTLASENPERQFSFAVGSEIYPEISTRWRDGQSGTLNGLRLLGRFPVWLIPRGEQVEREEFAALRPVGALEPRLLPALASLLDDFERCHGFRPRSSTLSSSSLRKEFSEGTKAPGPGDFLFPELEPEIRAAYY